MDYITTETRRNGLEAIAPKIPARQQEILRVLKGRRMTAREIAGALHYTDLNAVKPRLTELRGKKLVRVADKRYDPVTRVRVAVYEAVGE